MPKFISDSDLYPIETLIADRHDGWRIGEIEEALENQGLSFNRRTLQRRLAQLEKEGRILIAGVIVRVFFYGIDENSYHFYL